MKGIWQRALGRGRELSSEDPHVGVRTYFPFPQRRISCPRQKGSLTLSTAKQAVWIHTPQPALFSQR